jgi:hypothetical protein
MHWKQLTSSFPLSLASILALDCWLGLAIDMRSMRLNSFVSFWARFCQCGLDLG